MAAAADLEEGEGSGDGGVEAFDLAGHGDADQDVAGVADEAVEAGAFAADDDAHGLVGQLEVEQAGLGGAVEADAPDAGVAEVVDGAGEVGDLGDGEVLEVGNLRLRSLYTPGHAPGHLAFYIEDEGVVLSGDALFAGSVGRVDLPGGSMEVLMRSIEERLLTLPDETWVYPGHGPQTSIGNERTSNPFLQGGLF